MKFLALALVGLWLYAAGMVGLHKTSSAERHNPWCGGEDEIGVVTYLDPTTDYASFTCVVFDDAVRWWAASTCPDRLVISPAEDSVTCVGD